MTPEQHGFSHIDLDRAPSATGRLSGWLIPAKDLYDVAGMPTTQGSIHRTYTATRTEPFLARLEAQGALIPGKSAAPELGLTIHTEPVGLPHPDNPLHPGQTPGGSSGGAAVMVARGLVRAAHASDGGGSIRVPAAACGLVGFLPEHQGLSAHGFLTRSVTDTAFLHSITPTNNRLRVGVLTEPLFAEADVDSFYLDAVDAAAGVLSDAGHDVVAVGAWPRAQETFNAFFDMFTAPMATLEPAEGLAAWMKESGRAVPPARLEESKAHSAQLRTMLADYFGVDVLLTPMLSGDPPSMGYFAGLEPAANFRAQTAWSPWASLFNISGGAALALPWPVPDRAPVSVQLGALTVGNAALLGLARELEQ